jgi:nicotinamidase-related amidase
MSEPKTLLQLAGASTSPGPLNESALVLIDCQLEYVTGALPLHRVSEALAEAGRVLALARDGGLPVFHVVHHAQPGGGLFDPEGPFAAIAPEVAPLDGEPIIVKNKPNAFADTDLGELIVKSGRRELIMVGFMTHLCVSTTARAGSERDYRCTVVADAVSTRDLPDGKGGIIRAEDLHRAELIGLADRFANVVNNADALRN